jgi:hypothetical protein
VICKWSGNDASLLPELCLFCLNSFVVGCVAQTENLTAFSRHFMHLTGELVEQTS